MVRSGDKLNILTKKDKQENNYDMFEQSRNLLDKKMKKQTKNTLSESTQSWFDRKYKTKFIATYQSKYGINY